MASPTSTPSMAPACASASLRSTSAASNGASPSAVSLGLLDRAAASSTAFPLDVVRRYVDASVVEQSDRHAGEHECALDDVACGPGDGRDDRAVVAEQRIQQARFAGVRRTHQCDRETL